MFKTLVKERQRKILLEELGVEENIKKKRGAGWEDVGSIHLPQDRDW